MTSYTTNVKKEHLNAGFDRGEINRIHHGWSVEIGKSQPEGPPVPVGNEARRVSHRNGGPEGWDFPFSTDDP